MVVEKTRPPTTCHRGPDAPSAHRRPGYSLSGCTPAEPDSASPGSQNVALAGPQSNHHRTPELCLENPIEHRCPTSQYAFTGRAFFLVGRGKLVHFRLSAEDKKISRVHFLIEMNPPHCRLMDMCSRNGTYVNKCVVPTAHIH